MKKVLWGVVLVAIVTTGVIFSRSLGTHPPVKSTILAITFQLPEGYAFTEKAPFVLTSRTESPKGIVSIPVADRNFDPFISPYRLAFVPVPDAMAVILNARLYYCQKTSRMCFQDDFEIRVPLDPKTVSVIPWTWEIKTKQGNG